MPNTRWSFDFVSDSTATGREWRQEYNTIRPHSALGNLSPSEYAKIQVKVAERTILYGDIIYTKDFMQFRLPVVSKYICAVGPTRKAKAESRQWSSTSRGITQRTVESSA